MQLLAESDDQPSPSLASPFSVAYHAARVVELLGVDMSGGRVVAATLLPSRPPLPRQLALAGKIKLLLSVSEADYCPQIGERVLSQFSAEETDRAFYSLADSGWIAGQKRRRDSISDHRRYKLSSRYLDQLEPPKPLVALHSAAWLAGDVGQQSVNGAVLLPAELKPSSVLHAVEFMCAGHMHLSPQAESPRVTRGVPATASHVRKQGPSVRMHLLEGMLDGCGGRVRITPAQLAQLVPLVRLQARRGRYESGGGGGGGGGNRDGHNEVDARPPRPQFPLAIGSRRYVELDKAQAAAGLAACVTRTGQLAADVLAAVHGRQVIGVAPRVLDREVTINSTSGKQRRCERLEMLKFAVEALCEHSLLVRVRADDETRYVAHAWARCWTAEAFRLHSRTGTPSADAPPALMHDAAVADAVFEGKGDLTPFGKRPEYEMGSVFVAEVGRSIDGEVDTAHVRAIQRALLIRIAISPATSESSLLKLFSAFGACHMREMLTSLHVHGLLRCSVLKMSRVSLVDSEHFGEERLFHLKASATTGLSWLAAIDG